MYCRDCGVSLLSVYDPCRSCGGTGWPVSVDEMAARVGDTGKVAVCGMVRFPSSVYIGGDGAKVKWSRPNNPVSFTPKQTDRERLANQAEQIGALICRIGQLERENAELKQGASTFASRSEAALVERTFPENALKHSR